MENSAMESASAISQTPVEAVQTQPSERMFSQSQLNEIVGNAKRDAVQSYINKNTSQQSTFQEVSRPTYTGHALSEEDIGRIAAEKAAETIESQRKEWEQSQRQQLQDEEIKRIVSSYSQKMSVGKEKYSDFSEVVNDSVMAQFPFVVQLLSDHVENAEDVAYELSKNIYKMHYLNSVCEKDMGLGISEIKKLSGSINSNVNTSQVRTPNAPLTQQRPSSGTDSGVLSIKDYRNKYRG